MTNSPQQQRARYIEAARKLSERYVSYGTARKLVTNQIVELLTAEHQRGIQVGLERGAVIAAQHAIVRGHECGKPGNLVCALVIAAAIQAALKESKAEPCTFCHQPATESICKSCVEVCRKVASPVS